ncbi:MAG: nuclear transport factor 2 family protein [Actinomycetota bacterium]|nr:nuclear transport factor 2 family protein [Actinomycetota bacterium]
MTDPGATIARFYAAFAERDHCTMAACYAAEARFDDPVFPGLAGARIGLMWRMLCERATDLRIERGPVEVAGDRCRTVWQAWYTYSATGRPVHNRIGAEFLMADGFIREHRDHFSLHGWARQALGVKGLLLGWAPPVQAAIRAQAGRALDAFIRRTDPG